MDSFLPTRFKNIETAFCVPDETSTSKLFGTTLWWQAFWCTGRTYGGEAYHLLAQVKGSCNACWTIDDLQGADPAGLSTRQFASAPPASAASTAADRPELLFSLVASGMLHVVSSCSFGKYTGSGFLVGPQTMITALHVLRGPSGPSCSSSTVTQQGTDNVVRVTKYEAYTTDDLAVAHLSHPLTGFFFSIAPNTPSSGSPVIGLGYSLDNPLSLNQGTVVGPLEIKGVLGIGLNLLGAGGSSGGPILNSAGQVVGLTQRGAVDDVASEIWTIDLAQLARTSRHLCDAFARSIPSTLCGTADPGLLPPLSATRAGGVSWPPAGYAKWTGTLDIRWDNKAACSAAATYGCWVLDVISKSGCAKGVVVTLDEDRGKYVYGTVINSLASLPARTPGTLEIDGDEKGNARGQLVQIICL
jgi:hypothetical protein